MKTKNSVKFAIIGAGSVSFAPVTITDILRSKKFERVENIEIYLMDILQEPLDISYAYCKEVAKYFGRNPVMRASTNLQEAVSGADFVITAIEVDRYHYWSQDFHIPRQFGFRQIYGENGGPGGMFHFLRNVGPMIEIAEAIKKYANPNAWMLNYTNPEAKLVEAVAKLTGINVVGLCHGVMGGMWQLCQILDIPWEELDAEAGGLNHFSWFTKVQKKSTGEDLYPLLKEKEKQMDWLAHWDEYALPRLMLRTYGLWSHPGANHIGEYIAWSDELLASTKIQYFYDPAELDPWKSLETTPQFVYAFGGDPTNRPLFPEKNKKEKSSADPAYVRTFSLNGEEPKGSNEPGVPIAEAIFFDEQITTEAVNVLNNGYIPNVLDKMAVEVPAIVNGKGIHPKTISALPVAVAAMISQQGAIHQLLIEAYQEKSRRKLLQAMLLDPTVSNYNNSVALINKMCDMQSEILPEMNW